MASLLPSARDPFHGNDLCCFFACIFLPAPTTAKVSLNEATSQVEYAEFESHTPTTSSGGAFFPRHHHYR